MPNPIDIDSMEFDLLDNMPNVWATLPHLYLGYIKARDEVPLGTLTTEPTFAQVNTPENRGNAFAAVSLLMRSYFDLGMDPDIDVASVKGDE